MELVSDGVRFSLVSVAPERTLTISCWWKEGRGGRAGLFLHVPVTSQSAMMLMIVSEGNGGMSGMESHSPQSHRQPLNSSRFEQSLWVFVWQFSRAGCSHGHQESWVSILRESEITLGEVTCSLETASFLASSSQD